jgi:hypothetical protein
MNNSNTITLPREVVEQALNALWHTAHGEPCFNKHVRDSMAALRAALEQPQGEQAPYLWYDPENGDTWTQEAIEEGFAPTDNLIPLYTK